MSRHYGDPTTTEYAGRSGAALRVTHIPGGYSGSTEYEIEGTLEQVTAEVEGIKQAYPPAGYSTWFNWPPGQVIQWGPAKGQPNTHRAPTDLGGGRWIGRGRHSNSCD